MESGAQTRKIILKKLSKAIIFFVIIALAIPLIVGSVTGTSIASLLTLITSTFVLQAGAPLLGVGLGISNPVIIITMFCFALGMVLAVFEICDSLSETSERVQKWLEKMEKASAKYPQLQKYGVISCFFIAWIPPFGIYGAPVFAWLMNWKRWHAIPIIVASFTVASLFVLFFANKITEIMLLAANLGAMIFIIVSMVTLGLSTTVSQVLAPLKDKNLISRAILANFILVPVLAYLLVTGLHLPAGIALGLILVGTAAGSPFLARANQIPADKRELAGGLGVLLTIFSVFYIPVIAPFLVPGESDNRSCSFIHNVGNYYHYPAFYWRCYLRSGREEKVTRVLPWLDRISYGAFFATFIGVLFVFSDKLTAIIGYGGLLAIILFTLAAFGIGYLLGGYKPHMRAVLAFGTAQRGLSVALVFPLLSLLAYEINPGSSVYDPTVLLMIVLLGIATLIILLFVGKRLAKQGSSI